MVETPVVLLAVFEFSGFKFDIESINSMFPEQTYV